MASPGSSLDIPSLGSPWYYASAGKIEDTTAVPMVAAAGVGFRNYLSAIQLSNTDATVGTIVQIIDGASTVIWQFYVACQIAAVTQNHGINVIFPVPLRSSPNSALSVKCVTTSAEVYANAQGYVAP